MAWRCNGVVLGAAGVVSVGSWVGDRCRAPPSGSAVRSDGGKLGRSLVERESFARVTEEFSCGGIFACVDALCGATLAGVETEVVSDGTKTRLSGMALAALGLLAVSVEGAIADVSVIACRCIVSEVDDVAGDWIVGEAPIANVGADAGA